MDTTSDGTFPKARVRQAHLAVQALPALVNEVELAWALAAAIDSHLAPPERQKIYTALGGGDTFLAIAALLPATVRRRLTLPPELLATIGRWLDAYEYHDHHLRLRGLVGQLRMTPGDESFTGPTGGRDLTIAERKGASDGVASKAVWPLRFRPNGVPQRHLHARREPCL
jgi:hypothetical protein